MTDDSRTPRKAFYDRQVAGLEARDLDSLMAQYHDDAVVVGYDFVVRGCDAIRQHMRDYLARIGSMKLASTDRFVETEDSIFFEATIRTNRAEAKLYDVFILRDGKATHQFTGVIAVNPFDFPT